MLDLKYLANHTEKSIQQLTDRGFLEASDYLYALLKANESRKEAQHKSDTLAEQLKKKSKDVAKYLATKSERESEVVKQEIIQLKKAHKQALITLKQQEEEVNERLLHLPNLPDPSVPVGAGEADNREVHRWGEINTKAQKGLPHWELLKKYKLASFELGSKITGSGFPVYTGKGAQLQRALISFFLDEALAHGYEEVLPPLLVNATSAQGTGQLPDKEGMMYALKDNDLFLIPTAEVPITNLYSQTIVEEKQLPIRHVGYSACFRREAGSWGADVRGLNRLHQFDKVELVEIHPVENSKEALEKMRLYTQSLLEKLGLPYRTLLLCTKDLGQAAAITYDLEVWSPGQKKWLEVSSVSLFNDYQARRINLRYRQGKTKTYCHTLNGSALALPRIIAALLEHYQTAHHLTIPTILHPYTHFTEIASK
ncbi:MAG: serine--tRNA ligase [Bacteroidota bacterium]